MQDYLWLGGAAIFAVWHSFSDALAWRIWMAWYSPRRKAIGNKLLYVFSVQSHCEYCEHPFPWYGLIPIAGFFLVRRRCNHCGRSLSWRFPVLEGIAALYGGILGYLLTSPAEFSVALVVWCLVWIVIHNDYRSLLIPTEAVLGILVAGLVQLLLIRYPVWYEMRDLGLGLDLAVAFVWYFLFHLLRIISGYKMGLADVRLVLALGFLLGHPLALYLPGIAAGLAIGFWLLRRYSVLIYAPSGTQIPFGVFLGSAYLGLSLVRAAMR